MITKCNETVKNIRKANIRNNKPKKEKPLENPTIASKSIQAYNR